MIEHKPLQTVDYSFIMAPFYLIGDDELLRSQLINLNFQTVVNFEVIIPDPHYNKRIWLKEFTKTLKYNVYHFEYRVKSKVPKSFDYGILNDAVLISNSNRIITFQDWRFCHYQLIENLQKLKHFDFIGFDWQILYKDDFSSQISTHHPNNTIDINYIESEYLYKYGLFPQINLEISLTKTFHNSCWGHYCISKELWLSINGIDEVVTNTRHYADLDLNTRLQNFYETNLKPVEIPMIKNAMVRIMHNKGNYFGGSNIPIEYEINQSHRNCCFVNTGSMNDLQFTEYVINKIQLNEFKVLHSIPYSQDFIKNNENKNLDTKHSIIVFQCVKCKVIGETPHWYEKSPKSKIKSYINIGEGDYIIGRDLCKIDNMIKNLDFNDKINLLNSL